MENNFEFSSATVSDRGLSDKRPQNEDSFIALDNIGLFAVADGVGGAQAGDVASQMAMEILGEAFVHYGDTVDPEEIMKVAIERANEAIYQMASDLPQLSSMATTVAAIHLAGNIATIAHVGDSRVYRVDTDGRLYRETRDHSVVEEEVRAGRMTPEQALTHPSRNVISRAVGAEEAIDVDIRTIMVDPGTTFMLCSDGITRHIPDEELQELLTTGMKPELLCNQMKRMCFERGAEDNLTAIVVKIEPELHLEAPFVESLDADFDLEEETVAGTREKDSSDDEFLVFPESESAPQEIEAAFESKVASTEAAAEPKVLHEPEPVEPIDLRDSEELTPDTNEKSEYRSSSVLVHASEAPPERDFQMFGGATASHVESHEHRPSAANNIFVAIGLLLLGGVLGIAGSYFWNSSTVEEVEPAPILVPQSANPQVSGLEDGRRLVDSDPKRYIDAEAASPQDAVDFYLLGRAMLLDGRYFEAKRQFDLALQRLNDPNQDPKEVQTLRAEIAVAKAIIESPAAQQILQREIQTALTQPNSNSNAAGAVPGQ